MNYSSRTLKISEKTPDRKEKKWRAFCYLQFNIRGAKKKGKERKKRCEEGKKVDSAHPSYRTRSCTIGQIGLSSLAEAWLFRIKNSPFISPKRRGHRIQERLTDHVYFQLYRILFLHVGLKHIGSFNSPTSSKDNDTPLLSFLRF